MTHEVWSSVYIHNSIDALLLSQFILKLDYGSFKNIDVNVIS